MFKKLIAIFLTIIMIFTFTACSKKEDDKKDKAPTSTTTKSQDATVKKALNLIDKGDIEGAYDLLYNIKDRNEEQQELFQKFAWVKTEETEVQDGKTIFTLESTYNTNGYLLSTIVDAKESDRFDDGYSINEKLTYDTNNNLLSYKYDRDGSAHIVTHTYDKNGNMLSSKYGEHITEQFTYHSNGKLKSYTYKTPDNAIQKYGIYGPQLFTVTYDKNGNILTEKRVNNNSGDESWYEETYTYDNEGNMLTSYYHNSSDDWEKYDYTYDKKGNKLTEIATNVRDSFGGKHSHTTTYTYDNSDNILSEHTSESDGDWEKYEYTYDKKGNVLTKTYTDSSGKNNLVTNTYDKNGNIIKSKSETDTTTYSYDKNGNKTSENWSNKNGDWNKEIFTYDNNGNILTRDYSNSESYWEKEVYTYDTNGNLLTSSKTKSTGEFEHISNIYDDQGRIISHGESTDRGTDTITYKYDKDGNQIYDNLGYTWTRDKYGNVIKMDFKEGVADNTWGFAYKMSAPDEFYSYKLFYYPDGAPWAFDGLHCRLSQNPRTEFAVENPVTKKAENLPTSNFYYRSSSY